MVVDRLVVVMSRRMLKIVVYQVYGLKIEEIYCWNLELSGCQRIEFVIQVVR